MPVGMQQPSLLFVICISLYHQYGPSQWPYSTVVLSQSFCICSYRIIVSHRFGFSPRSSDLVDLAHVVRILVESCNRRLKLFQMCILYESYSYSNHIVLATSHWHFCVPTWIPTVARNVTLLIDEATKTFLNFDTSLLRHDRSYLRYKVYQEPNI